MKIGVTGTRFGMNSIQEKGIIKFLKYSFDTDIELHEGDCIGVDAQVVRLAYSIGYRIVSHPPIKDEHRAFYHADEFRECYNHLKRNRNIVDEVDHLMVVPYQNEHQNKGGTWYTYDYAKKKNKPITVFYPDGRIIYNESRTF